MALPPRPPFSADTYARDEKQDYACFSSMSDPSLPQRTLAAMLRIEDLLIEQIALMRSRADGVPLEAVGDRVADLVTAPPRGKPGPKPKGEAAAV